jgi:hypothetical protein
MDSLPYSTTMPDALDAAREFGVTLQVTGTLSRIVQPRLVLVVAQMGRSTIAPR